MEDLRPGDVIVGSSGTNRLSIRRESHGCITYLPLAWENLKDYARWWIRQSELRADINIPKEQRLVFQAILDKED